MEIILAQIGNDIKKLVENKPGEFTFSGFKNFKFIIEVEESDVENEYNSILISFTPKLFKGQQLTDKLKIKSIIFDDGRYKILTELIEDDNRINNEESQDRISDNKETRND